MFKLITISGLFWLIACTESSSAIKKCARMDILYKNLGCTPCSSKRDDCPSYYTCPEYNLKCEHCRFKTKFYFPGDELNATGCNSGCRCGSYIQGKKSPDIMCPEVDCFPPPDNKTYAYYKELDQCCSSRYKNISSSKFTCKVNKKRFYEGEIMYPDDTCYKCICQKNFCGKYEKPFCKRIECESELRFANEISKKCAPVFFNGGCCPSFFLCHEDVGKIKVIKSDDKSYKVTRLFSSMYNYFTENQCSFEKKKFNIGDRFNVISSKWSAKQSITCSCDIPPLLTCLS